VVPVAEPSAVVQAAVGTPSVAEAAAILAAGEPLQIGPKKKSDSATALVATIRHVGQVDVVGIGPGGREQLTFEALNTLRQADVVVGYRLYTDIVRQWLPLARISEWDIGQEEQRVVHAIEQARSGQHVALVSSGDAGIYGLAGLVYESLSGPLEVKMIPGLTAAGSAATLLGAPLMADFAAISLSDLHVPSEVILSRLRAAAQADLVAVLYNPASQRRRELLAEAQRIFLEQRPSGTPAGLVRNAYRAGQTVRIVELSQLPLDDVDMFTTVVIGNSQTRLIGERMVTQRTYRSSSASSSSR